MGSLGLSLVTVLDQLRISRVVVLGEGAGANIAARFAACHPSRVQGLVLVNCKHAPASFPAKLKVCYDYEKFRFGLLTWTLDFGIGLRNWTWIATLLFSRY